jgi:predicted GNAT family N-acyltransferase
MNARVPPPVRGERLCYFDLDAGYQVSVVHSLEDLAKVNAVRTLVYIGEQRCPYEEEFDGNDLAGATHLLLCKRGEPVGALRLRWFASFAKVERVAIRAEHRGGRGAVILVRTAIEIAERKGYSQVLGHAQARVVPFWRRHFRARVLERREKFVFSDHDYVEVVVSTHPPTNAISLQTDPMVLLRPEGEWDRPGILDHSASRGADLSGVRHDA